MLRLSYRLINSHRRLGSSTANEFDLIVIGAGSAGLSCSKAAAGLGAKVALIDAVAPTPRGVTWGIGGTCANVGCIPKKLMHEAALVGKQIRHAPSYGWEGVAENVSHNWKKLVKVVNDRIKANNWIYRVQINEKGIKYYNSFARFVDSSNIMAIPSSAKNSQPVILTSPRIVISTGLRPKYPKIDGAQYGITSDDLFSLPTSPGRTLVVGGGYVALETAGLLAGLGFDVELLIRSIPLRGFDRDCVNKIVKNLEENGVGIKWHQEVERVEMDETSNEKIVKFTKNGETAKYETIVWAMGREANLERLDIQNAKVAVSARNGRILADEFDRTTSDGVYAIGDVVENRAELTPLAIQAGNLLAQRMFGGSKQLAEYHNAPTTVFTPLELSTVGMTEEDAIRIYDEDEIEVFHSFFTPFEFVVPQDKSASNCYVKLVCKRNAPRAVLGMHFVGPNAAEVMQGYAVAFRRGVTYDDVRSTIAIHPCSAEEFVKLTITKRSGQDPMVAGCCG